MVDEKSGRLFLKYLKGDKMVLWIPALATGFGAAAVDTLLSKEDIKKIFTTERIVGAIIIAGLSALAFSVAGTPTAVSRYSAPVYGTSGLVQVD